MITAKEKGKNGVSMTEPSSVPNFTSENSFVKHAPKLSKPNKPFKKLTKSTVTVKTNQSHDISSLIKAFRSSDANENKKIKKMSSDVSKLYRKINKMASDAKEKYDLELFLIDPHPHPSNLQSLYRSPLLDGLPMIDLPIHQSPLPLIPKGKSPCPEYTIKFRDNKIPNNLMKKLAKRHQNDSFSVLNNSKILLPDSDKFGLNNKNLPSVYD